MDVPVPIESPPHSPVNQTRLLPLPPIAVRVMLPGSSAQKPCLFTIAETGACGKVNWDETTKEVSLVHPFVSLIESE